jgi:hypothetical protein
MGKREINQPSETARQANIKAGQFMGSDAGINVMPLDDMLPMVGSSGGKFAMKFNPEHQQHGWIFYDNHGQWVTLRRALPHEVELAKAIIEMRKNLPNA